jgi:hypothetical protein
MIKVRPETKRIWRASLEQGGKQGGGLYISEGEQCAVEEHHDPEQHEQTSECCEGHANFCRMHSEGGNLNDIPLTLRI